MNKSIALALAFSAVSVAAFADTSVNFANGSSVGTPLVLGSDSVAIHDAKYVAQLFISTDGGTSFSAVGTTSPFKTVTATSPRAGIWASQSITLTGLNPSTDYKVEVAVWDSSLFATWDAAAAEALAKVPIAGKLNVGDTFQSGLTAAFNYHSPAAFDGPAAANLVNFTGLTLTSYTVSPEPSVVALGALGLGALLWRRRK